jgi:hypothetical protein
LLSALATAAAAEGVVFDSLDAVTSSAAFAGGIDPAISATFNTGTVPARVDVVLLLRDRFPEYGEPATPSRPQFAYWIEVGVHNASGESVIEWGMTADISWTWRRRQLLGLVSHRRWILS